MWSWEYFTIKLLEQFVALAGYVAWPALILILMLSFRRELKGLLDRLSTVKASGIELGFQNTLREIRFESREEAPHMSAEFGRPASEGGAQARYSLAPRGPDRLEELAESSPTAAVLQAWEEVEAALFAKADKENIKPTGRRTVRRLIPLLFAEAADEPNMLVAHIQDLEILRNMIVHTGSAISSEVAKEYVRTARGLQARINSGMK